MLFSTPLLRAINLSIAVLLVALLAAIYWFAWRPLPETSGEIAAPISAKATVSCDALGVPHIQAASWQDAIFLQGFVTAQDRMWQMDALRRLAAGQLAEVVGKQALASDEEAHRLRLGRIAQEYEDPCRRPTARCSTPTRAESIFISKPTATGCRSSLRCSITLPAHGASATRFSPLSQMYRTLTPSWRQEVEKFHMLQKGDRAKVEFLYPGRTGGEIQPGSNAWAIAGARTATGKPILANDPHLEFSVPSTWYMVHLHAPGLDVTGVSLPGVPAVIIGHNDRIAWGVTNLQFDVQDLYREQIDPQSGRYVFRGQLEQARLDRGPFG